MKRKIQFLVITGLLLVITIACQNEELFEKNTTSENINKKISLEAAKSLFEAQETQKREEMKTNKSDYFLELTPDWNSFSHQGEDDSYYSKIETTLFGSKIKGEILFLGTNDSLKQYLFMTRIDSVDADDNDLILNARFYFFTTNGKLLEAYKMEKGKITNSFYRTKQSAITARSSNCLSPHIQAVVNDEWTIGCGGGGGGGGKQPATDDIWGPDGFSFNHTSEIKGVEVYGIRRSNNTWLSHWVYINNFYDRIQNPRPSALSGGPRDKSDIYGGGGGIPPKTKSKADDKIEDKQLKQCMQKIVDDLKKLSTGVNVLIKKFAGNTPKFNWEMRDGTLPRNSTGTTNSPAKYNHSTETITSTFDSQQWKQATELSWARTILHEAVHANLAVQFAIDKPNWVATYPQMVQEWGKLQNWNAVHHEEMARSIVKDIAIALEEYGVSKGYKLSKQFYQDMAWGGLENTSSFQNLPLSDKTRIKNTIVIELTGKDNNGISKKQKGNPAGC